ncbi:hypothetical protein GC1_00345 [Leisingera sp. ANG1]|nr:hypothetical protein RA23_01640 [Leisingera sp. ANG-S3]KIC52793.1 hypothetical protein RA22_14770 [Leisingera sp. ANG-S]KID10190.1 hypothetical protein GC1_00345 [Leisingera sp. ANG1]
MPSQHLGAGGGAINRWRHDFLGSSGSAAELPVALPGRVWSDCPHIAQPPPARLKARIFQEI